MVHYRTLDPAAQADADAITRGILRQRLPVIICPDCGQPLNVYFQHWTHCPPTVQAECKTHGCTLEDVTHDADTWQHATPDDLAGWRLIVAGLRR